MEKNDFSLSLSMIHAWIEQLPLIQQQELCRFIEQKIAEKQTNSDKENQAQTVEKGDAQNNFAILLHLFYKISEQTQETHLREFSKELRKIYPTENSLVTIISDYDEEENSVGLSIYVASPALLKDVEKTDFYAFFAASLTLVEPAKLKNILVCFTLMERKVGEKYDIDFVPVFFNDKLNEYYLHCRITKIN